MPASTGRAGAAVAMACTSLRRRKAVEEGAHATIIATLAQGLNSKGLEMYAKAESLQQELNEQYKAKDKINEELVHQLRTTESLTLELKEKNGLLTEVQQELEASRLRLSELEAEIKNKDITSDLLQTEVENLRARVDELQESLKVVEAENKDIIDRFMKQKLIDAEQINEANAMYQDLMERNRAMSLADLATKQVDGIVRHVEAGAENYLRCRTPSRAKHTFRAHDSWCSGLAFKHCSDTLVTGGHDKVVKMWDVSKAVLTSTLRGPVGSVLDFSISADDNFAMAATEDRSLYLWDVRSGHTKHVMTGHTDKVTSVCINKTSTMRRAVSSSADRSLMVWDLDSGYKVLTLPCHSVCHSLVVTGHIICSGHFDGNLRIWDPRTGVKPVQTLLAHEPNAITSVSLSRNGQTVLTNGRDNLLHTFDLATMEKKSTFKAVGYVTANYFSRACMSGDERFVVAGSADGSVFIWNKATREVETILKGHACPVVACAWSYQSSCLATGDKNGDVCIWN